MTKDEALRLALDALYGFIPYLPIGHDKAQCDKYNQAVYAIKEALETKDEFVAWEQFYPDIGKPQIAFNAEVVGYVAPQRTWVGLTDEERQEIHGSTKSPYDDLLSVEAKLRDKNNPQI